MSAPAMTAAHVIESVARLNLHEPADIAISLAQTSHRFDIVSKWNIQPGSRVLELGCGQGDCTVVLAHLVGHEGHVTAVDPAPPTYGSPFTLGQCHAHLSAGALGSRITWVEADPIAYLDSHPDEKYDIAVFVHSIWYFDSPTTLKDTFRALASHTARVGVAEWALSATSPNAMPHVLAAFTLASLYLYRPNTGNIRCILSPLAVVEAGVQAGALLLEEHVITPAPELQDGRWEVMYVTSSKILDKINSIESVQERNVLSAFRDAVISGKSALTAKKERVHCMDVWIGLFRTA